MYKNIFLAIDDSKTSKLALEEAVNISHAFKSRLHIVHVIDVALSHTEDTGLVWFDPVKYQEAMIQKGQKLLNGLEVIARSAGVQVTGHLIENTDFSRISDKLLETSTELKADLLILGTHGRRGFRKFILGSVAEDIVRLATVPVLLIRGGESD